MVTEFLIKYWELFIIGFLVLNLIIQKIEKIKGRSDVLTWIWQFLTWIVSLVRQIVTMLFSTTPGKLPILFIGLFLLIPLLAFSATNVTFTWDANTESDLAGYRIYQSTTSGVYTFGSGNEIADIPAGTEIAVVPDISDGTYFWVATAYDTEGKESPPSDELTATLDAAPGCPKAFRLTF